MQLKCAGWEFLGAEGLFKFSTGSMEWTDLRAAAVVKGTPMYGRYGHTMTAVGTEIYLFGGYPGSSVLPVLVRLGIQFEFRSHCNPVSDDETTCTINLTTLTFRQSLMIKCILTVRVARKS